MNREGYKNKWGIFYTGTSVIDVALELPAQKVMNRIIHYVTFTYDTIRFFMPIFHGKTLRDFNEVKIDRIFSKMSHSLLIPHKMVCLVAAASDHGFARVLPG